jgi:hypothetical protein
VACLEILSRNLLGGSDKTTKHFSQDNQCLLRDSNRILHLYKSEVLSSMPTGAGTSVTDSSWISIMFQSLVFRFYSTDGARGRYVSLKFVPLFPCIGAHALGFVG